MLSEKSKEAKRVRERARCHRNKAKRAAQRREWYAKNRERVLAQQKAKYAVDGGHRRAKERARSLAMPLEYHAARTLRYRQKLKAGVIAAYGGKCWCCGESHQDFLTLDHLNNDGKAHRMALNGKNVGNARVYRWLRDNGYPRGYGVACFNCNISRSLFGSCPHRRTLHPPG